MKKTPYIYILLFFSLSPSIYSQTKRLLTIDGKDEYTKTIIQQIKYNKLISTDSIYTSEITQFRKKLNYLGFIQHRIDSVSKNDSLYYVRFSLKQQIKYIRIIHPKIVEISKITNYKIKKAASFIDVPIIAFSSFANQLSAYYQNNGFPFVEIKLTHLKKDNTIISAQLKINKNKKRRIDKIIVKGYTHFSKSFINRRFNLRIGDLYNKKQISRISKECASLAFVSEIKSPELLFTKDSTAVYLYLKREKSNHFDGLVGFSSSKDKKGIQIYGNIDLKIDNALNTGESLELKWHSNQDKARTLDLSVGVPYIFKTAFSLNYRLNIHKQDSLYSSLSNLLETNYSLSNNQNIGFVMEKSQSNKTTIEQSGIEDFNSFFYGTSYVFNKPNKHPVFNTKIFIKSQVSQGKRDGLKQYKLSNRLQYLYTINHKNNILLKNTTEVLISKDYIENELFRIGGSQSIRGFEENNFMSTAYSYLSTEYNYLVDSSTFLSGLVDIGIINNKLKNTNYYTYSMGIGFSQKTKMGQLGIQYFIGNIYSNPFSFKNSKLHISIAQTF